ncbi:hypothetical protein A0H81_01356 [Grifola frondosa]|uniref:SYO1-like TPR repeats domain-containing protein n=1 Tax=Grifola frondosa TaxID=5627 RepID=A0A1C7MPP1_GRIFR|nr:hypothetical protein A0H81_01356 [Grifola frondosa]
MGKSQKKRQMRRHNPMRVPDSHLSKGLESATASSSKGQAILPIIQKMESPDASERKWACVAVSNLIQNDPSTRRLLQGKNVVGALITRLSDSEEEVVVEATGALRNLCIDGGYDICAEMYNKNMLVPLKTFVPKISGTLAQFLESPKNAPENARKLVYEFADSLRKTSETSNKALNAINKISLVPFLMSFLASRDKLPLSTVTSAAYSACLLSIVRPDEPTPKTNGKDKEISDERASALRVLVCGILRNISPIPPPSIAATVDIDRDVVLPILEPVLSSIPLSEAAQLAQQLIAKEDEIPTPQLDKLSLKNAPKSDHKSPSEVELESLETKLRTVQLALEALTGVCATLPDPEVVSGSVDDQDENRSEDEDMEEMNTPMDESIPDGTPSSTPNFFHTLVEPLLRLIQPTSMSFPPPGGPSPHPPTTSVLSAIHISALECLNNIFLAMAAASARKRLPALDAESGRKVFAEVWRALGTVGTEIGGPGQERRQEMERVEGRIMPSGEQVQLLMQLCGATTDVGVKVKCIGTLECLAQHAESVEANRVISAYLLSLLPPSTTTPTEPLLQAVSALIDIYADETLPYDINFRQGRYIDALVAGVEGVRKAVRGIDRKKERELRWRGEEARDNLVAFIEYRRGLGL